MGLPLSEKLDMLCPPSRYYARRIAAEIRSGEPELALLADLFRGGTAVDAGANQGFFAYALARVADRVIAFEPNPDYARFARWMLRGRAAVHQVALSDGDGEASFYVPISDEGTVLHFAGNLKNTHAQFNRRQTYRVKLRTLDSYAPTDVRFIKVDVEGSEREVLDGGRETILRDRPVLLLELLSGTHADPAGYTASICDAFGYQAHIVHRGQKIAALPAIAKLGKNTTWGTDIETRNVLFTPGR